jgi:uncharacterized protein YecE (DUF72 family)
VTIYIGTSGWDYAEWRGHFYPPDLPRTRFLEHYSRTLNACELNATFYGRQTENSVARWNANTPVGFVFSAKAHMRITYTKQMAPDKDARIFMSEFVTTLSGLGPKLGVLLMSFPAWRERDDEALEQFLAALPSQRRYAFEFRHASWDAPEVRTALEAAGATLCYSDDAGTPPPALPDGLFAYVRLRADAYSTEQKDAWLKLLQSEAGARDVFVFARHKGIDPGDDAAGVSLASWLANRLPS